MGTYFYILVHTHLYMDAYTWMHVHIQFTYILKYLSDLILRSFSTTSLCPLRSSDQLHLFVPWVRTSMTQLSSCVSSGPSLWNGLPPAGPAVHSTIISRSLSSFTSKPAFSLAVKRVGSASERHKLREVPYKRSNTIHI